MIRTVLRVLPAVLLALLAISLPTLSRAESEVLATGRFEGRSDHVVTGGVTLLRTGTGVAVVLESDFSLDGAPDPKLALGRGGYDRQTLFSPLRTEKGLQVYALPASLDPARYDEVWVWCEKFDVPLGVARLVPRGAP